MSTDKGVLKPKVNIIDVNTAALSGDLLKVVH